jgi:hypothetical protein
MAAVPNATKVNGKAEAKICSKCQQNLAAPSHQWCNPCKAAHQQEWRETHEEMLQAQAFAAGAKAQREMLAQQFAPYGAGFFAGIEIARYIATAPAPQYRDFDKAD